MDILKLNARIFKIVGICSLAEGSGFLLNFGQLICAFLIGIPLVAVVWGSGLSMFELIQMGDFGKHVFILIEVLAPIPILLSFTSLVNSRRSVRKFCDRTQRIFDRRNLKILVWELHKSVHFNNFFADQTTPASIFYLRADRACEFFAKWTLTMLVASILATVFVPAAAGALYYYIIDGYVETTNLHLALHTKYGMVKICSNSLESSLIFQIYIFAKQNAVWSKFNPRLYWCLRMPLDNINNVCDRDYSDWIAFSGYGALLARIQSTFWIDATAHEWPDWYSSSCDRSSGSDEIASDRSNPVS